MKEIKSKFDYMLRVIEVTAIVAGVILVVIQIGDVRNANYGLTSLEVSRDLYSDKTYKANPKIIDIIHQNKKLLAVNGGPVSDEELNNFLGIFEWIYSAKEVGILNDKIIKEMFSTDIMATYDNREVQDFIQQARRDYRDNDFFSGFESLAKRYRME